MTRITILLTLLIVFNGCENPKKFDTDSYEIINSVIEYHKSLIDKSAEVFPNTGDTILYADFRIIPQTSQLTSIIREESKLFLSLNGSTSRNTEFDKYFNLTDSSFIEKQLLSNLSKSLDTTHLAYNYIPYHQEFDSYFQADSLIDIYNKDLIFLDRPIINSEKNISIICYVYVKKSYQITKLIRLGKDLDKNSWKIVKQYGIVYKYTPDKNDLKNDSVLYTIYIGSIER